MNDTYYLWVEFRLISRTCCGSCVIVVVGVLLLLLALRFVDWFAVGPFALVHNLCKHVAAVSFGHA